ncbi:MAG: rRNA maturation RNase YbeY [Acidobacteriota bacterium]|nr:rRNA maturation RNase YbeY [Acidobacteriota bacterium]
MKPSRQSSVLFHVKAREVRVPALRRFARTLADEVAEGRAFCCLITDDDELRRLNREFRKKDYATDVLSFPSSDGRQPGLPDTDAMVGDIAISLDRAEQQARVMNHSTEQELRILMLHGVLHLTGLDHENDHGEMACAERRWRQRFGLPAGLIERVSP